MTYTAKADVENQVIKRWSPMFMGELIEDTLLAALVNKDYQGEIGQQGDTVYVSQIQRPLAQMKTIGTEDADTFSSAKLETQRVAIVANKRITASYKMSDLVDLQSQLGGQASAIRQALLEACEIQLNNYLYSLVSPSTSAPDHLVTGVTDFNATQLNGAAMLASQAKWRKQPGWWCLADPSYSADLRAAQTLTSSDYGGDDQPVVGGQFVKKRFNFNILEDNSAGLAGLTSGGVDAALLFHPDFMHLVMQKQPTFQLSSLHAQEQHGYVLSVDMIVGATLGIDGDVKHILVMNS